MAGNVPKRVLKQPEVDKCLLGGTRLWKFEEVHHQFSILTSYNSYWYPFFFKFYGRVLSIVAKVLQLLRTCILETILEFGMASIGGGGRGDLPPAALRGLNLNTLHTHTHTHT